MKYFNGILLHKSGLANKQYDNQSINQRKYILKKKYIFAQTLNDIHNDFIYNNNNNNNYYYYYYYYYYCAYSKFLDLQERTIISSSFHTLKLFLHLFQTSTASLIHHVSSVFQIIKQLRSSSYYYFFHFHNLSFNGIMQNTISS